MSSRFLVITNPAAGTSLFTIGDLLEMLNNAGLSYDHVSVESPEQVTSVVGEAKKRQYEMIVAFGGDGTMVNVIKAAIRHRLAVLPLPGGSANVFSVCAGIPGNIRLSIDALAAGTYTTRRMAVAAVNGEPLVLDLHFGLFAEAIADTSSRLKGLFGTIAYHVTTLKKIPSVSRAMYDLDIDGTTIRRNAYACYVVNNGKIELFGKSLLPAAKPGHVRVLMVFHKNPVMAFRWYASRILIGRGDKSVIRSWYAKEVIIREAPRQMTCDDDHVQATPPLTATADEERVSIVVPLQKRPLYARGQSLIRTAFYRHADHFRRRVTGVPSERFSRVDKHLFLGGQYGSRGVPELKRRGVTGIVSMRKRTPKRIKALADIDILHLPTTDLSPPAISDLKRGVGFMERHIAAGGSVYVHCRLGEGRGPTMAAAYLISQGMKVDDALDHLRRYRPFARPNHKQVSTLRKFAEQLHKTAL